jgi:SAM-dependent methyltransferase
MSMPSTPGPIWKSIGQCRICGFSQLHDVLEFGSMPLANSLETAEERVRNDGPRAPLTLTFCEECSLVQIRETVDPETLFGHYLYFSSVSSAFVQHARELAERTIRRQGLRKDSLVVEAASNDGYLLRHYRDAGVPVLGVEPAENIARVAEDAGIRTRCRFFSEAEAEEIVHDHGQADVFHANNVLAHVADQNDFVRGVRRVLKPGGIAIFEFPYLGKMIENLEFDTIYHEHLCYFSMTSATKLFEQNGLAVLDVEHLSFHGGSLRVTVGHPVWSYPLWSVEDARGPKVKDLIGEEHHRGLDRVDRYLKFVAQVNRLGMTLWQVIFDIKRAGGLIAAYGASAKGSTLMNYFGIDDDVLEFVADRSLHKQGLFTPGNHLPILSPDELIRQRVTHALLLTWNFYEEISSQNREWLDRGGVWIIPLPLVTVTGASSL